MYSLSGLVSCNVPDSLVIYYSLLIEIIGNTIKRTLVYTKIVAITAIQTIAAATKPAVRPLPMNRLTAE